MTDASQLTHIEQAIEIEASAEEVFAVLTDPNNITRYAGGIEGAEVLSMPNGDADFTGAQVELVTKSGNVLRAEVLEARAPTRLVVRDERGVTSSWDIADMGAGKVRLTNVIDGPIPHSKALKVQYDADVKFQALQSILETKKGLVDVLPSAEKTAPGPGPVDAS